MLSGSASGLQVQGVRSGFGVQGSWGFGFGV